MRRTLLYYLLCCVIIVVLFTTCVASAEECERGRYGLLYGYQTDDGGWMVVLVDANFSDRDTCETLGADLVKGSTHSRSTFECLPLQQLEDKTNGTNTRQ